MKYWILCFALLCGCGNDAPEPTPLENVAKVRDYGNGVYYFPFNRERFGKTLAFWRPGKKIVTITPNDTCGHGRTCGYFVIVEEQ